MKFLKSPKFLIFLIVFVNFLGYGIVFPILPLMTERYGGNPLISGILIAAFSVMQVAAMPVLGRLSDRFGRRPWLLFSLWGTVISFAIMGFTHSIFWLMVARLIDGASGGNISIAQAYMADITSRKERAGGMGIITAGIFLGFVIGPLWGGFFSVINLSTPFLSAAAFTLVSVLFCQFFLPESVERLEFSYEKKHFDFKTVIKNLFNPENMPYYATNLLLFWAQSGVFTTIALFGKDVLRLSIISVSFIFALGGLLGALIQGLAIGRIVERIPEEKLFLAGALVETAGFIIMAGGNTVYHFTAGMVIFSLGNSLLLPVVQSLVSEKSSAHEQGGNLGILQSFGAAGRIFGPVVAGYVYEMNPYGPAMIGAAVMALISVIGVRILAGSPGRKKRMPVQSNFSH